MKSLIILFIFSFAANTMHAQILEVPNNNDLSNNIPAAKQRIGKENFPQANFLFNTDKGKVYSLPLDNMPCVVPPVYSNMPIVQSGINQYKRIPNAIPEQELIPKTETLLPPSEKK